MTRLEPVHPGEVLQYDFMEPPDRNGSAVTWRTAPGARSTRSRKAEDEARLTALREAARIGIADIDAGRFEAFDSPDPDALRRHLANVASRAIAGGRTQLGDGSAPTAHPIVGGGGSGLWGHPALDRSAVRRSTGRHLSRRNRCRSGPAWCYR